MNLELINFLDTPLDDQLATRHWRNSPQVAQYFQLGHIEEATHRKWLESLRLPNPASVAYFIRMDEQDIGVTYFHSINKPEKRSDWGIYIYNQDFRHRGLGGKALCHCLEIAEKQLGLDTLFLEVLPDNIPAKRTYEKAGFLLASIKENGILRYSKKITLSSPF